MIIEKSNFLLNAIKAYDNIQCRTLEQFKDDIKKFSQLKKLLKSNKSDDEYIRLTLNTIVYLYNVFEVEACTKMMFSKVRKDHWFKLKTYLIFLNQMPDNIEELSLIDTDIPLCPIIAKTLRII